MSAMFLKYSGFEKTDIPVEQYLLEAFTLLRELPHTMQVVMDTSSSDAEGGYGWHRYYHIAVYEIGKRCEKCGTSTFDRYYNGCFIQHHHSWCEDERLVFSCQFSDIGMASTGAIENLKDFVKYTKNRK